MSKKKARYGLCIALIAIPAMAFAHGGATGIIKHRMDAMTSIGDSMKLIVASARGQRAFDKDAIKGAAARISAHATDIPKLFPEGSLDKPTEAVPAIWQDWDRFTALATDLETSAKALETKVDSLSDPSELGAFIPAMGQTCKSCHESFRIKK